MQHTYNEFKKDLEYSLDLSTDKAFNNFYYEQFPQLKLIEFAEDLETQKKGVDKILHFENGGTVTIDEKKRRKDYGDILLELFSNYQQKKKGWLFTCSCDYIVYYIEPTKKAYLLPAQLLKMAWKHNGAEWLKKYKVFEAKNPTYSSKNISIPTEELINALKNEMCKTYKTNI